MSIRAAIQPKPKKIGMESSHQISNSIRFQYLYKTALRRYSVSRGGSRFFFLFDTFLLDGFLTVFSETGQFPALPEYHRCHRQESKYGTGNEKAQYDQYQRTAQFISPEKVQHRFLRVFQGQAEKENKKNLKHLLEEKFKDFNPDQSKKEHLEVINAYGLIFDEMPRGIMNVYCALNNMEKKNLVKRKKTQLSNGKRAFQIYLTENGRKIAKKVHDEMEKLEELTLADFSQEEKDQLFSLMDKVCHNLNDH